MEKMTKKELSQLYWLNKEIAMWQQKLERMEEKSTIKGKQITGIPSGGSRATSKVEEQVIRREEIKKKIAEQQNKAEKERARLLEYITGIEDSLLRQIIQYRFVELKSWKEVAWRIGGDNTAESVRKTVQRFLKKQNGT